MLYEETGDINVVIELREREQQGTRNDQNETNEFSVWECTRRTVWIYFQLYGAFIRRQKPERWSLEAREGQATEFIFTTSFLILGVGVYTGNRVQIRQRSACQHFIICCSTREQIWDNDLDDLMGSGAEPERDKESCTGSSGTIMGGGAEPEADNGSWRKARRP